MKNPLPTAALAVALLAATPLLSACQTDTAGVTSSYRTQSATVMAGVQDATEAAAEVLEELELRDVTSTATEVDGQATGMKADGTEVTVYADRESDTMTELSVTVGTVGEPELGKDILKKVQDELN